MKIYLSLARKELRAQKITSILILIAIILSTVMTTVIGQSIGILQSMRVGQATALNGDRYATFQQLTEEQQRALSADERLINVGSLINLGSTALKNSGLTLYVREYCDNALTIYPSVGKLKEGHLPTQKNEIALPEDALQYMDFHGNIGNTISLTLNTSLKNDTEPEYVFTADYVLCGILESNYIGYSTGIVDGIVGEGTSKALLPERYLVYSTDFKVENRAQFQNIVFDLSEELGVPDDDIQYNWLLLDTLSISYIDAGKANTSDAGFSFMSLAFVLVGILILFAAGLVIYNILKIAVAKRIREYGTLRAIGGEKKQLYRLVTVQLLCLCGIGIPLGAVLGLLSSKGILTAAMGFLNPEIFMASSTQELTSSVGAYSGSKLIPLFASAFITLLFAAIAAFPAARYASSVSPTTAMSGQAVKIKRRSRKARKIKNFEAFYARLNLKRNRGRTAITILSLVMSIVVFVSLQSFSGILDASANIQQMHTGDYSVTNENTGISVSAVDELQNNEMVDTLSTTKSTIYFPDENGVIPIDTTVLLQGYDTLHTIGLDDNRLTSLVSGLNETDKEALKNGSACLIKNPVLISGGASSTEISVGDTIQVGGQTLRVVGIIDDPITVNNDGFINGVQVIVCNTAYQNITGQELYTEVYPTLKETADTQQFEDWLNEWCNQNVGSHWLSYRQADKQLAESFSQINLLCWGLILFVGLIGILNIINTVYTNIHTRVSEIGVQRAIGMDKRSLYKTFLWEGAYYGIIAAACGCVIGYLCSVFIGAAATDTLQFGEVPIAAILEATVVSVAACLVASVIPLRSIAKANIVTSIATAE